MADATYKVSFFLRMPNLIPVAEYSFNLWSQAPSFQKVLDDAEAISPNLHNATGKQTALSSYRIATIGGFRDVESREKNYGVIAPGTSTDSDYVTTAARLSFRAGAGFRNSQWLRGVGDDLCAKGGFIDTGSASYGLVLAFTQAVMGNKNWVYRALDRDLPPKPIAAVDPTSGLVTFAEPHGFAKNDIVRISRVQGITYANRIWRIQDATSLTINLSGWRAQTTLFEPSLKATARKQAYTARPITSIDIVKISSHKTGGGRGRRSGKAKIRR